MRNYGTKLLYLFLASCLFLTACFGKKPSAQTVLKQARDALLHIAACTIDARVEMAVSVYGEEVQLSAWQRMDVSFSEEKADGTAELYQDGTCTLRTRRSLTGSEALGPYQDALDMDRFLNSAQELFFAKEAEDTDKIYTVECLADAGLLGAARDWEEMAGLLPVLEPQGWAGWTQGLCFPVQIRIDRQTLLPVEVAVNISEAAEAPVREAICALGIDGGQVQTGSCVLTFRFENFQ